MFAKTIASMSPGILAPSATRALATVELLVYAKGSDWLRCVPKRAVWLRIADINTCGLIAHLQARSYFPQ